MKSDYDYLNPLFRNPENVKFVKDALFGVMNEPMGTAYGSRLNSKKYQYAGKTGTSQIKRITEEERELEIKNIDKAYEDRDHAVFIGFGPYENPRYALSVFIEHGGSGSTGAAPLAKKMLKLVFDRHEAREKITHERMIEV
jgi:penicillin-binding protein 2